jgi:hypothetical protein
MVVRAFLLFSFVLLQLGRTAAQEEVVLPDVELSVSATELSNVLSHSLAADGDLVVVGAVQDDAESEEYGFATVFRQDMDGEWTREATLTPEAPTAISLFGTSVAVSGEVVVVGAPGEDSFAGAVYAFRYDDELATWSAPARIVAEDASPFDNFGHAVSCSGDTVVIGAWADDGPGEEQPLSGSATVFVWDSETSTWLQQARLTAASAGAEDCFGWSVAVDGDAAVIGAHQADAKQGAACVFRRSEGVWSQEARLEPSDGTAGDAFGWDVGISGDTVVVGAPFCDTASRDAGAGYVFVLGAPGLDGWSESTKLTVSGGARGARCGNAVTVVTDVIVLGAPSTGPAGTGSGGAYRFEHDTETNTWTHQRLGDSPGLGSAVAVAGTTVVSTGRPGSSIHLHIQD